MRRIAFVAMSSALAFGSLQAQVPMQPAQTDFSYWPVSPGAWTYRAVTGGSEAAFVDGAGATRMVICPATWPRSCTPSIASRMSRPR